MAKTKQKPAIALKVDVPVSVPESKRKKFEGALVELLFGQDRVRPEAEKSLRKAGVNTKKLARLTRPRRIGLCPSPGDFEFLPNLRLARAAKKAGISLLGGGRVTLKFDYKVGVSTATSRELNVHIGIPESLRYPEVLDDMSEGLFGSCTLPKDATDFLHAHGIDLDEITTKLAPLPPTTRVSPRVAAILAEAGFTTERMGTIKTRSMDEAAAVSLDCGTTWSKRTCC
jgi:hypothetical protein